MLLNTSTESTEMVSSFGVSSSFSLPDTSSNNDSSLAFSNGPTTDTRNNLSMADEALTERNFAWATIISCILRVSPGAVLQSPRSHNSNLFALHCDRWTMSFIERIRLNNLSLGIFCAVACSKTSRCSFVASVLSVGGYPIGCLSPRSLLVKLCLGASRP